MRSIAQLSAAAVLIATASLAQADAVRSEKNISLELANQIASAGVAACAANGHAVVVTVVDRAGIVRAGQRADNAGPHSLGSAERKAWTSASAKTTRARVRRVPAASSASRSWSRFSARWAGWSSASASSSGRPGSKCSGATSPTAPPR